MSSPSRGSIVVPRGPPEPVAVRRRLDFSHENYDQNNADSEVISRSPQKRGNARTPAGKTSKLATLQAPLQEDDDDSDQHDDPQEQDYGDDEVDQVESEPEPESELEPEPEPEPPKKSKGKGKAKETAAPEPPVKKGRGRKKRDADVIEEPDESPLPAKKTRRSLDGPKAASNGKPSKAVATKEAKAKAQTAAATSKGKKSNAKKTNLAPISENESPAVQRGPPLPRTRPGLVLLRRETPMEDASRFKQTRFGRHSVRPLAYWKNERIEYSEDENELYTGGKFLLPRIRAVVRADEVEEPPKKKYPKSTKGKKRAATVESEEDEAEPWETDPGRLVGEIRSWDPEDQTGMNTEEMEEEIALSATAIVTRDTAGGSFKFAKTLTMPFFGSGMVDLPPGGVKKPKNSRKMQMVFFVFYGRVEVTVNDSTFRIGKGGMWQVPRG